MKNKPYNWKFVNDTRIDEKDFSIINTFNEKCIEENKDEYKVIPDLYPEGCIGNPHKAKVILLALNPGYVDDDSKTNSERKWYKKYGNELEILLQDNLLHNVKEYPYYYLNDKFKDCSPGHEWFENKTKELQKMCEKNEINKQQLSNRVSLIQFFPYHSKKYKEISRDYLPSQKYHFELVLQAMEDNKLIICMRSIKKWDTALFHMNNEPEKLSRYTNLITLKNYRNPCLTINNMQNGEEDFTKIINAFKN